MRYAHSLFSPFAAKMSPKNAQFFFVLLKYRCIFVAEKQMIEL